MKWDGWAARRGRSSLTEGERVAVDEAEVGGGVGDIAGDADSAD